MAVQDRQLQEWDQHQGADDKHYVQRCCDGLRDGVFWLLARIPGFSHVAYQVLTISFSLTAMVRALALKGCEYQHEYLLAPLVPFFVLALVTVAYVQKKFIADPSTQLLQRDTSSASGQPTERSWALRAPGAPPPPPGYAAVPPPPMRREKDLLMVAGVNVSAILSGVAWGSDFVYGASSTDELGICIRDPNLSGIGAGLNLPFGVILAAAVCIGLSHLVKVRDVDGARIYGNAIHPFFATTQQGKYVYGRTAEILLKLLMPLLIINHSFIDLLLGGMHGLPVHSVLSDKLSALPLFLLVFYATMSEAKNQEGLDKTFIQKVLFGDGDSPYALPRTIRDSRWTKIPRAALDWLYYLVMFIPKLLFSLLLAIPSLIIPEPFLYMAGKALGNGAMGWQASLVLLATFSPFMDISGGLYQFLSSYLSLILCVVGTLAGLGQGFARLKQKLVLGPNNIIYYGVMVQHLIAHARSGFSGLGRAAMWATRMDVPDLSCCRRTAQTDFFTNPDDVVISTPGPIAPRDRGAGGSMEVAKRPEASKQQVSLAGNRDHSDISWSAIASTTRAPGLCDAARRCRR